MKKLFILLLITNYTFGQIIGKVQDTKNTPLSFANVILYSAKDSYIIAGTTTNEFGEFTLKISQTGDFFIKISFIGYENFDSKVFNISDIPKIIELETIYLKEENNTLDEVTISAQRELIQTTAIGKIINIQSSLLTKGSNALQVFERLPGVITDRRNNQFSLNGQNGVTVLFNGRKVQMPVEEIMALLENTVADNIEKIELITSPTAQYDADGGAGIINIIFKNNETLGTKINFSATAGYGYREKTLTSIGFSKGYKKLNLNASYAYNHDARRSGYAGEGTAGISFILGETINTFYGIARRYQNSHNLNFAAQYQPNATTTLGLDFVGAFDNSHNLVNNGGTYHLKSGEYFEIAMLSDGLTSKQNNISSVYFKQSFSPKTQFNADLTYINYANNSPSSINAEYFDKQKRPIKPQFSIFTSGNRGESISKINVGVFKTDLSTQFSDKLNVDFGIKISYAQNENDSKVERKVNEIWEIDPRSQSQLKSQEQIAAAYSQFKFLLSSKANLLLGLRYEYWKRYFSNQTESFKISKLFPSVLYTYAINLNTSINFNYSRRISRPAYTDLISNLFYTDPTFVFSGNPLLKPTLSDMLKVEYSRNGLSVGISAQYDLNPILRYQITANATKDLGISSPQNLDYMKSLNLFVSYPWQITQWWKFTLNSLTSLRNYKVSYSLLPAEKRFVYQNLNISQQIKLPKNYEIELSGWYNFPYFEGPNIIKAFGAANVGLGKKLNNDKGTLTLTFPDVFRSFIVPSHNGGMTPIAFDINTISTWRDETALYRVVKLTYSRSFGKNTRSIKYDTKDEERERMK
ncbi:outer membrane beta-barrel protein [Emticicia sp. SJ17W-69]|uniref:outer membrane beta-barrel protein n=1 Tax=Emticicia sp. SJ17W-69 TaxID=3421657 RepID=UPI003EB87807